MNNIMLYIIVVLIWGSTWIAITFQLGEVAPAISIVYRFALASLILFIFCLAKKHSLQLTIRQHIQVFIFGIMLFGTNYYFVYHAQQYINSALTCIACSLILFFNILNARIWFKTQINVQAYVGTVLGIIGMVTLFWPQLSNVSLSNDVILGVVLAITGTFFASIGNMASISNKEKRIALMPANAWGMFYGALAMSVVAFAEGVPFNFSFTSSYILSLLYLSIFGSVIAFGCYLTLLNNVGTHKASYVTIMFPAVAVLISTFVESFEWNIETAAGMTIILLGNLVILDKPKGFIKRQFSAIKTT